MWNDPLDDGYDPEAEAAIREREWATGWHTTVDYKRIKIRDMTITHLENTIKHFDGYDTSVLKKEIKRRYKNYKP